MAFKSDGISYPLIAEPIEFSRKLLGKLGKQLRIHELVFKSVDNDGFKLISADITAIRAGPFIARSCATEKIGADLCVATSSPGSSAPP